MKKCETNICGYEEMRDEETRHEEMRIRRFAYEDLRTKICATKKCGTKICPDTPYSHGCFLSVTIVTQLSHKIEQECIRL